MSAWTTVVLFCAVQVTVLAAIAWLFYVVFRRRWPAMAAVPQATLGGGVLITLLAAVPWRPWSWELEVLPAPWLEREHTVRPPVARQQAVGPDSGVSHRQPSAVQSPPRQSVTGPVAAPKSQTATARLPAGEVPGIAPSPWKESGLVPTDRPHRHSPSAEKNPVGGLPDAEAASVPGALGSVPSPREESPPTGRSGRRKRPRPGSATGAEKSAGLPWWAQVNWLRVLAALVLVATGWGAVRMLLGLGGLALLVRRSRGVEDPSPHALLRELAARLGLRHRVLLRESDELSSAATVGVVRPVVLLPSVWRTWSRQELEAVLAHELAHIRRGDFLRWLAAQLGLVLHYYHPLVHWLAARVRLEQELAADELAVEAFQDRVGYLDALARLMLDRPVRAVPLAARTFLPNGHSFLRRIEMLRHPCPGRSSPWRRLAAGGLVLAAALLVSGLRHSESAAPAEPHTATVRQAQPPSSARAQAPATRSPEQTTPQKEPPASQAPRQAKPAAPKLKDLRGVWTVDKVGMVQEPAKQVFFRKKGAPPPSKFRLVVYDTGNYMLLKEKQMVESGRIKLLRAEPATLAVQLERLPNRERVRGMFLLLSGSGQRERWAYLLFGQGVSRWAVLLRRSGDLDDLDVKPLDDFPLAGRGVLDALVTLARWDPQESGGGAAGMSALGGGLQGSQAGRPLTLSLRVTCRTCHGPDKLPQDRELSLAYVPRDSLLVAAARMDKFLQLPVGELYARMLKSRAPAAVAALDLRQIEQITMVQLGPGRNLGELFRGPSALVLRMRQKISPEQAGRLAQALLRNPRQIRQGQTAFWQGETRASAPVPLTCLWRSDDGGVLVLASSRSNLLRVLAAGTKGASEAAWATRNSVGSFLVPYRFAGTLQQPDEQALLDVHYWLAAFDSKKEARPRRAHLLVYLPVFRLHALAESPDYQPLQRMLDRQVFGRAEEVVVGVRAHRQTVRFAALFYTHPIHILPVPGRDLVDRGKPSPLTVKSEKLQQELNQWIGAMRAQLSRQRMRVAATGSPGALAMLQALEEVEGVLDNVWVYGHENSSFVVVQGRAPLQSLRQLGMVMLTNAQNQAQRSHVANNLWQIAIAMHNYHTRHGRFPPAVFTHYQGRKLKHPMSWRVALLPYLGYQKLFDQYRMDEPWDSPNNRKVLEQMPPVYRHPLDPPGTTTTAFYALTGPGTVFEGTRGISVKEIPDGTAKTILVVEARRDTPWTKPEDIPFDPKGPLPRLGGYFAAGFHAAFADGSVRLFSNAVAPNTLRLLILRNDGKVVRVPDLGAR